MEQLARSPGQVGHWFRERRRQLGLSQTQLGEKTSIRQATVSALESGEPGTSLETLFNLLAALNLEFVVRPRTKSSVSLGDIV